MFPALLATLSFALSTVCGHRATKLIGGIETNFWRLVFSTLMLAAWANTFGGGFAGKALPIFIVSGLFGIGLGDVAFYTALPRLGPRLALLVLQCLTTVFAVVIEWVWLGTRLTPGELLCGAVILTGVAIALHPREWPRPATGPSPAGQVPLAHPMGEGSGVRAMGVGRGEGQGEGVLVDQTIAASINHPKHPSVLSSPPLPPSATAPASSSAAKPTPSPRPPASTSTAARRRISASSAACWCRASFYSC